MIGEAWQVMKYDDGLEGVRYGQGSQSNHQPIVKPVQQTNTLTWFGDSQSSSLNRFRLPNQLLTFVRVSEVMVSAGVCL